LLYREEKNEERNSAWLNLNPAEIRVFKNAFYDFEAPGKIKTRPSGEAPSPLACEIGAFIGLHGQKNHLK
jgi:hypothetical protein